MQPALQSLLQYTFPVNAGLLKGGGNYGLQSRDLPCPNRRRGYVELWRRGRGSCKNGALRRRGGGGPGCLGCRGRARGLAHCLGSRGGRGFRCGGGEGRRG